MRRKKNKTLILKRSDLWGSLPPEEKLVVLNQAYVRGLLVSSAIVMVAAGLAVGFKNIWLFWSSFFVAPLVFKMSSNEAFKRNKAGLMLRYLAASRAARRYADKLQVVERDLELIFQGDLRRELPLTTPGIEDFSDEDRFSELVPVWIVLFDDAVIIMSEGINGARSQFLHQITRRLWCQGFSPEGESDYSAARVVELGSEDVDRFDGRRFRLTSKTPGALVVFEKKLQRAIEEAKEAARIALERRNSI
jgi:hypothetical protein